MDEATIQGTEMDEYENTPEPQEDSQTPLGTMIDAINIAEKLSEDELKTIGQDAKAGFDADRDSRGDWEECIDEWTKLAKLTVEQKVWPWPKASNVKYPLLATASMQFAARAYPSLIPSDGRVVKARVVGKDLDGSKTKIAEAVSIYMSYQLLEEMEGWEEGMDKLLMMLPIVGTMFKKTYWDPIKKVNCSKVILPKNLVVDYWATSLEDSERISEVLLLNPRIVKEKQMAGLWLKDVQLPLEPSSSEGGDHIDMDAPSEVDATTPYMFVEQHAYLDLDDDGYKEPYVITFHYDTAQVVRISARFDDDTIFYNEDNELVRIEPIQFYTKYGFLPNPDGSFYDIGFGLLLGPINESVNTLINQLVDSGTINNLQSGFIGKGLRLRMGETRFNPGEWKVVNSTGDDLKKQIVPLPSKEPSKVLLDLMQLLITSGKELASVAEIFVGKMPGQNTPATTTMASIEQGMKVFTAVYKRIYRALGEEFCKLYRLNGMYLNPNTWVDVVGMSIGPEMFNEDNYHKIIPGADPTAVSQTEKLMKAQGLMEMLGSGMPLDPVKVMIRMLEAQEQPNWQELIPQQILQTGQMPPPPPDPKLMAVQAKTQADMQKGQNDMQIAQAKAELDRQTQQTQLAMKQQEHEMEMQHKQRQIELDTASTVARTQMKAQQEQAAFVQQMTQNADTHNQNMQQNAQNHAAQLQQAKQKAVAVPNKGASKK